MDDDHYDEFGNYIGPEILSYSSYYYPQQQREYSLPANVQVLQTSNEHRIILHYDKKYYQSHEYMYPYAEIMIYQYDRQALYKPLLAKPDYRKYDIEEPIVTVYESTYLFYLMKNTALVRNVCVAGHLAHGKTLLMDLMIQQTHLRKPKWNLEKNYRWLDTRIDEQYKQLSIKAMPITLLLPNSKGKHYVFNFIDTPGHPNFIGYLGAGMRLADGVLLVVDAIYGVMLMTYKVIKLAVRYKLKLIVVINKIDRLIIEMKIPPEDAYLKLKHTLEEINVLVAKHASMVGVSAPGLLSPALNNVFFASAEYSFMFSLESIAQKYKTRFKYVDTNAFKNILWGDYYYHSTYRKFKRVPQTDKKRTFVEFVLEPIYKIFSHSVGKDRNHLYDFLLRNLDITLSPEYFRMNIKTMIKLIMSRYFDSISCIVSCLVDHIDTPNSRAKELIAMHYRGEGESRYNISMGKLDGPLLINAVKMYHEKDYKTFNVLGKVISGTIKKGDYLRIMGYNYHVGDYEDVFIKKAVKIYLLQGRYKIEVDSITAGNLVLIAGIDQAVIKGATITHPRNTDIDIIQPIKYWTQPTIKIAIEPLVPNELPKMIEAIRQVNKSYLLLKTKVEESGYHILIGNGEMHLDCILHDIRKLYSDIEIRISDPCVCFAETVIETSGIPCYADTPNKKNRLTALAGPLERSIADHVEKELVNVHNQKEVQSLLENQFNWDLLAAGNVWAFGPEVYGSNVLINDSLVNRTDQSLLGRMRQSITQGFKWSTREGPLCDEPMRNVKFRVIEAELSKNLNYCQPGQLIPTARRVFYSAFLTANPRMMEPVYYTEIQCTSSESIEAVFTVLAKRRGAIQNYVPKPGTPHYIIKALLPCIEALGFETDLRIHTIGQAFSLSTFDHWQNLSGDPLDKNIILRPLYVMEPHELARYFMLKTRRRKGLNETVSISKYFDDLNIKELLKNDTSFKDFI